MPDADKSTPRYSAVDGGDGYWYVGHDGGIFCRVADVADPGRTARRIALALNREPAFAALVAALRGLIEAVERDTEGRGVSGYTGARLYGARVALKLAEAP